MYTTLPHALCFIYEEYFFYGTHIGLIVFMLGMFQVDRFLITYWVLEYLPKMLKSD